MYPERFSFIVISDLMGKDAKEMARELSSEGTPTTEGDILVVQSSQLYESQRAKVLELFRRACVRSAGDTLIVASAQAAEHLRNAMKDMLLKPSQRLRAAIEVLDHVPETSKTLRQYVSISTQTPIPNETADRMAERLRIDPKATKAIEAFEEERTVYRENLSALINAK